MGLYAVATSWLGKGDATSVSKQALVCGATAICGVEKLNTPQNRNSKTRASGYQKPMQLQNSRHGLPVKRKTLGILIATCLQIECDF